MLRAVLGPIDSVPLAGADNKLSHVIPGGNEAAQIVLRARMQLLLEMLLWIGLDWIGFYLQWRLQTIA